jgi:glyoxylase-like metal-dependent hydrolase (beta-lactamase superfamily II)
MLYEERDWMPLLIRRKNLTGKILMISILSLALILIIITYIIFSNLTCKTKPFSRNIFSIYNPISDSEEGSNRKEFLKTTSLITVKPIHSGELKAPLSSAINLNHPSCSGMKDRKLAVPIFAYLIHHERLGYFLIDSGCDSSYISNPYGKMKGLVLTKVMPETILKREDAIDQQIEDIRSDIKGVFFTHLHFDHTSGLPGLPNHLLYFAGNGEKPVSIKWFLEPNHFKKSDSIYMLDFDSIGSQTTPLGKAIDIFGDQSFWAISTPGHTKGHTSYLVNTKDHPVLVAGDACCINLSMELGVGPAGTDTACAQKTFDKIMSFINDNPQVKVWFGHDFPK